MDNESSYNCSFLFSSLVDDHDPDSQDNSYNKSEANSNSNSNSLNNTSIIQESRPRKKARNNNDGHSDGFNPNKFFVREPIYNHDDDFYISPAALNANITLEDVLVTKTNIFNQPHQITEINEQCEIFTNDRGTVKLCVDGCLYIKNMKSGSTCYWQCVQKNLRNCHGCAVTYAVGEKHYLKRIRREHTHDPGALNTRGFSKIYQMQMKNLKENLSDCRFTKNRWGNPKLVLDGYFYVRHNTSGELFYWKCEQRGQCEACVVTQKNSDGTHKMGHIVKEHTHQPKNENDIKELRLSYIPKFSQSHLDQINKSVEGEQKADIPNKKVIKAKIGQTATKPVSGGKAIDEGDSSSSMSLYSSNMPKLLTLKSSCDQNDEQMDSDNSQTTSQFTKKTEKTFSRQSSQTSISQSSAKSSMVANDTISSTAVKSKKTNKEKLEFKRIEVGEKCEFVFLIDGIFKMLLNGFAFELAKGSDGKSNAVWRCSGHSRIFVECLAIAETIIFEGDHYLKGTKGQHNHPPCDEDVDDNDDDDDDLEDYNGQEDNFDEEDYSIDPESADGTNNLERDGKTSTDPRKIGDEDDGKCQFIVTKRGLPKLTREGYYYVRNSVNKNRSEITYWKCELKGKCTGTLVTCTQNDGYYVKSSKEHNHPPDPHKYAEPRFDEPEQVNHFFTEADSQINEDSSEEVLITPENELKPKISNKTQLQDPLAEDSNQNTIVSIKTIARSTDVKLDLITTARGMPKIARNGYYYCKSSVNKNRQEITYWKCELKGQCKGFLISITKSDGYYFKSERTHSHPPDPDKYISMRKSSFEELNNSFGTSFAPKSNFVKRENFGESGVSRNPWLNANVKQCINKSRNTNSSGNSGSSHNRINPYQQSQHYREQKYSTNNDEVNDRDFHNALARNFDNRKINRNGLEELPLVPEGGDPNMTYECEFIISCQGNPKLCLNGYMYTKNRDKNTNFYWNCEIKKSQRCMGYCVTEVRNGKHIVKKIRAHNHTADLRREMLSKKLSNILQKVYAKPLWNPRKIIDYELSRLPDEIRRQLPKAYSIQRMVKRKVQEKVSTVRQSLENGEYAPIPNMEPSTSKQPQPQQQNRNLRTAIQPQQRHHQYRNPYSGRFESASHLYNDEYNFNNLYNSNNRSNSSNNYYQRHINDMQEEHNESGGYNHNQMNMDYNDTNDFRSSTTFNQNNDQFGNDDVYNCEIKNEPIDDYGYQNYEGEIDEQMDLSYDNNAGYHESMDATDSWNNGSAFDNSCMNDEAYDDNYENYDDGNRPTTTATAASYNSNAESSNSSHSTGNSKNSVEYHNKQELEEKQESSNSQNEIQNQATNSTNTVVYKKNQIAKKRIRAPDRINN